MSRAARVSDRQIALPFAEEPGTAAELETALRQHLAVPFSLAVTDHRQTMITTRRRGGVLVVRVHRMFLLAQAEWIRLLARYLQRPDRRTSRRIGAFIEAHRHLIRASSAVPARLRTAGRAHDLAEIMEEIGRAHFGCKVDARIGWGVNPPRRRRRSIKFGSYGAQEKLIRVSPVLDREWVPRYFVAYIVFHEMLHHVLPARAGAGRRVLHGKDFRERERAFPDYERALAWEKRHLGRLLAASLDVPAPRVPE